MKLIEIYKSILAYCALSSDDNGNIFHTLGEKDPVVINGKRLVLPVQNQLRNFNAEEKFIFHPLTENILRNESDIVKKLRHILNIRLNYTFSSVAAVILQIAASPSMHSKLTPEQSKMLTKVGECDDKTITLFTSLMVSAAKSKPDRAFLNIYLNKGGTYRDKRYGKVGVVFFPFYEEIDNIKNARVKDKAAFKDLFKYMFPNIEDGEAYNYGSDSHVAPYLDALLKTSVNIAQQLNDLIDIFRNHIEAADELAFSCDWLDYFTDLNQLIPEIRKIPVITGNDGSILTDNENSDEKQIVTQPAVSMSNVNQPQPVVPQYPTVQQPMVAEVKKTKGGLDFNSVVQRSPTLAFAPNPLAGPQMMQPNGYPNQMVNNTPSWAMPTQYPGQYPQQPMMQQYQQPMMPNMGMPPGTVVNTQYGQGMVNQQGQVIINTPQGPAVMMPNGQLAFIGNQPGNFMQQPAMMR